jgi:ABC-type multidrug transport system fused ATPase/permease subunit
MKKLTSDLSLLLDRRSRIRAAGLFVMMLVAAGLEGLGIGAIMPFLALVTAAGDPDSVSPQVAKLFEGRDPSSTVLLAAGLLFGLYVVKNLFLFLTDFTQFRFVFGRHIEVATRLFDAYMRRPYEIHMQRPTAELLRSIDHDVRLVFTNVFVPALTVTIETLTAVAIGVTLFYLDPQKTPWIIGVLFLVSFSFYLLVRKGTSRLGKTQQFQQGEMIKWVNYGIHAFKEIRVARKQEFFVQGFRKSGEQFARAICFHRTVKALPLRLIEVVGVGAILLVVALTIGQGGQPAAILPRMGLLAAAAVRLMPSVNRILTSITAIRHFYPALEVVADEFRTMDELPQASTPETPPSASWEAVRFDDVSYRYPGATKDAVSNVTFQIGRGESVALVGRSGAGKTTIADLLLGLLTPTTGQIKFEGASREESSTGELVMGYVPQPSYLLDESVRRNVAFGTDDADIDDARVSRSLDSVRMKEVVETMDGQLASRVGRDGVRMSGGQRQRLGIARALYDDPEILILDEATSALDNETERDVSEAIMALAGQRTLVIIAHRLTTVKRCDKVLFFDSGRLVAEGDYDTLSVQSEPVRRLINAGEI